MPQQKGFTLIELLVVISIVGMLSSVIMASLNSARNKAVIGGGLQYQASTEHANAHKAVVWWKLDNNLNDATGFGNTGASTGVTFDNSAPVNTSRAYYGVFSSGQVSAVLSSAHADVTNGYTWMAWIKPTSATQGVIVGKYLPYLRYETNGTLFMRISCTTTCSAGVDSVADAFIDVSTSGLGTAPLNTWTHVAATYIGGYANIYINGKLIARSLAQNTVPMGSGSSRFTAGAWETTPNGGVFSSYFAGNIDDVFFANESFEVAQIEKHYAATKDHYAMK